MRSKAEGCILFDSEGRPGIGSYGKQQTVVKPLEAQSSFFKSKSCTAAFFVWINLAGWPRV